MRLVFVTPAYRPSFYEGRRGGGEISNQILLNGLAKDGVRVFVISLAAIIGKSVYRDGHIIVLEPRMIFPVRRFTSFFSMFFFRVILAGHFRRLRPDVSIGTTSVVKETSIVSKKMGVPVGAMVRAMENLPGHGWKWNKHKVKDIAKYLIHKLSIGWPAEGEIDNVDFIVSNSEFLAKRYRDIYPDKDFFIFYPPLDIQHSLSPLPESVNKVMMVGVSQEKGFHLFCKLAENFSQLDFHAIGDPSLCAGEKKKMGKVTIHGWISDPITFIDHMDLLLVPSVWEEPFGRIAIEALYRNKFVFVSSAGGLPEAVGHQQPLIIHSESQWEKRMDELLEDKNIFSESIAIALDLSKQFSLDSQLDKFKSFLRCRIG